MFILNETTPGGRIGEAFGSGIGQGLQSGLNQLAQQKLNTIVSEKKRENAFRALKGLGFNHQEAEALSYLDEPSLYRSLAEQRMGQSNGLGGLQSLAQEPSSDVEQGISSARQSVSTPQFKMPTFQDMAQRQYQKQQPQNIAEQYKIQAPQFQRPEESQPKQQVQRQPSVVSDKNIQHAYKETKGYREEVANEAKAARDNNMRLKRISALNNKGDLQNPLLYSTLKKIGLDVPALKNADSQELEKLSSDFLKSAKDVFGARLTDYDVETFLSTVPTLSNTKEGRDRVIRNMELFNKGAFLKEEALRDILKENGGVPTLDLPERVNERIAPQLDQLAQEFSEGIKKEFSVGQQLQSLPDPRSLPVGTQIRRKDGVVLENTGSDWVEVS